MNANHTDKRYLKSKLAIEDAIETIYEKGKSLSSITVSEIAEIAHIARKTFYLHYVDINDFICKFISEKVQKFSDRVKTNKENFDDAISSFFVELTETAFNSKFVIMLLKTPSYSVLILDDIKLLIKEILDVHEDAPILTDFGKEFYASGMVSTFKYWLSKLSTRELTPEIENKIKTFVTNTSFILSNQDLI